MQSRTRTRTTVYAIVSTLIACAAILSCEAAGHLSRFIDSGQPRELINQPVCRTVDNIDELRRCEIAE